MEDATIADVMAFSRWPDRAQAIARRVVSTEIADALRSRIEDELEEDADHELEEWEADRALASEVLEDARSAIEGVRDTDATGEERREAANRLDDAMTRLSTLLTP